LRAAPLDPNHPKETAILNSGCECNRLWVLKKSLRLAGEI
jgi:hypothetical protein